MKKFLEKVDRFVYMTTRAVSVMSGVCAIVLVGFLCISVFFQRVILRPIVGVYEISQYVLMPLTVMPGFAAAYYLNLLPKLSFLSNVNNNIWQWFCLILNALVEILVFALMSYGAVRFAIIGTITKTYTFAGSNWFPLYPFYWISPIGFIALEITIIFTHVKKIYEKFSGVKIVGYKAEEIPTCSTNIMEVTNE